MPCRPVHPKSGHWSVVIYSFVIRSFSNRFPFQKGKNEGNISKNDMIKNDATSSPKGKQRNVGYKYATLSERWRKMAKCGEIPRRKKSNFRAKRQTSHWIVDMLIWCKLRVESWELRTIRVRQQLSIFNFQLSIFNLQLINGQRMTETRDETCQTQVNDGNRPLSVTLCPIWWAEWRGRCIRHRTSRHAPTKRIRQRRRIRW